MPKITRRNLIKYSAYGAGSVVISTGLIGCGNDVNSDDSQSQVDPIPMSFTHGVASGDPLNDKVIIWTRAVPDDEQANPSLALSYEVATDVDFTQITNSGEATINAGTDFILKVDAQNLEPETTYYYRFTSNGKTSAIGKTKTLPLASADVDKVKFAVFSCANYPIGYFNAYSEAAKMNDLDAVVHLGDYIYEYKDGEYGSRPQDKPVRGFAADNDVEIVNLEDYRKRYALYRSDVGLQTLHANSPFIVVPDDHEVTNDTYKDGAENHNNENGEGDFNERKLNALKAYFEWLPIRPATEDDEETLYRSFTWGNLVDLMMLDTRLIGRDKQLPGLTDPQWYPGGNFDAAAFGTALLDDSRTMLGADQLAWLQGKLQASASTWQVLGQQVLMGRMTLPVDVIIQVPDAVPDLVTIKTRILQGDITVTDEERARLNTVVPYNLDAWDGYQHERDVIFNTAQTADSNLVVLAGDTHNAWANDLRSNVGDNIGVEFATASVSSPGLEDFLALDAISAQQFEGALSFLIDDLKYANFYDRGLMLMTFTATEVQADWLYVNTIKDTAYQMNTSRAFTQKVKAGDNKIA